MFRVPVATGQALKSLPVAADLTDLSAAASAYRDSIGAWSAQQRDADPLLALVLVPHSERWQTDRPYYEAKAAFANLGIPSQMVTTELVAIAECERSADGHAGRASRSPEHAHRVPAAGHRYQRTLSPAPDSQRRRVTELPLDLAAP